MNSNIVTQDFSQNYFSKRKREKEKFSFGMNSTYIALLSIITLLFLYYVWILNINATKGYNIVQLEIEKTNLLMEKEQLYVRIAELESLTNIINENELKNMEKIVSPDYLVIKDNVQYVYNY